METILKFFKNKQTNNNNLISRTMLKIAVISRHFKGVKPNAGELWRCKIIKEINPGTSKGCFVVDPIAPIKEDELLHLVPGFFYKKIIENHLIIVPKRKGPAWMLPLQHKRLMSAEHKVYAVMVILNMSEEDILQIQAENVARLQELKDKVKSMIKIDDPVDDFIENTDKVEENM